MSSQSHLSKPARLHKRAMEACVACRACKVRCDVINELPCIRCFVEGKECVTSEKTAKRLRTESTDHTHALPFAKTISSNEEAPSLTDFTARPFPFDPNFELELYGLQTTNQFPPQDPQGLFEPHQPSRKDIDYGRDMAQRPGITGANIGQLEDSTLQAPSNGRVPTLGPTLEAPSFPTPQSTLPKWRYETSHLPPEDLLYLTTKGVFDFPAKKLQDELVHQYFVYIHPSLPILNQKQFWEDYENGRTNMSLLLYRSILSAATTYVSPAVLQDNGFMSLADAQNQHYQKAKLLFDFETEPHQIVRVQASLLLSFWQVPGRGRCARDNHYWLSGAISIAKELGLHRQSYVRKYHDPKPDLLTRIWWSCILRDVYLAIAFRRPPLIRPSDHDIPLLAPAEELGDFEESRVYNPKASRKLSRMFWLLAKLIPSIWKILDDRFSPRKCQYPQLYQLSSGLAHLLDTERLHNELIIWHRVFMAADDTDYLAYEESSYRHLLLHRNFILILYQSSLIILNQPHRESFKSPERPWGDQIRTLLEASWLRTRQAAQATITHVKELAQFGLINSISVVLTPSIASAAMIQYLSNKYENRSEDPSMDASLKVYFHALECMAQKYPVVEEVVAVLRSTFDIGKQNGEGSGLPLRESSLHEFAFSEQGGKDVGLDFAHIFLVVSFFDFSLASHPWSCQ